LCARAKALSRAVRVTQPKTVISTPRRAIRRDRAALKRAGVFRGRPLPHEQAQRKLADAFDARRGALYDALADTAERKAAGIRAMRSDGAANRYSAVSQLLDYLQPNGAMLRRVGTAYECPTQLDLGLLAYGQAAEHELNPAARFHRHLAALKALGMVDVVERWEQKTDWHGEVIYRAKAAFIRITDKLIDLCGIRVALRKLGEARKRQAGERRAAALGQVLANAAAQTASTAATGTAEPDKARPPADPERWRSLMADAAAALGIET